MSADSGSSVDTGLTLHWAPLAGACACDPLMAWQCWQDRMQLHGVWAAKPCEASSLSVVYTESQQLCWQASAHSNAALSAILEQILNWFCCSNGHTYEMSSQSTAKW